MNKTMKLLIIPLLFLFGCEQGIDVSSPPPEASHQYKLIKLPERMGMGPLLAINGVLERTKMSLDQMDLVEMVQKHIDSGAGKPLVY